MPKRLLIALSSVAAVSSASANLVAIAAESATLGSNWTTVADAGALSGSYITPVDNDGGSGPGDAGQIATFSVTLPADTFDLWARIYIDPAGNQTGSNATTVGSGEDSFFPGNSFGVKAANSSDSQTPGGLSGDWVTVNNLSADGAGFDAGVANSTWTWINLTDTYDGSIGANSENVPTYTSAGATETFVIGNREMGLWIDAFAFVTSTDSPTVGQLDAAVVPEPSAFALLSGCLALGFVMLRRR